MARRLFSVIFSNNYQENEGKHWLAEIVIMKSFLTFEKFLGQICGSLCILWYSIILYILNIPIQKCWRDMSVRRPFSFIWSRIIDSLGSE